jgi:prevent-host-death family protein
VAAARSLGDGPGWLIATATATGQERPIWRNSTCRPESYVSRGGVHSKVYSTVNRPGDVMERTIGVDKARAKLGQLAEEIAADDESVVLTRRGEAVAVLVSPAEYDRLVESRRRMAQEELRSRLARVRENVVAAGLDVSIVDEAITAAQAAE